MAYLEACAVTKGARQNGFANLLIGIMTSPLFCQTVPCDMVWSLPSINRLPNAELKAATSAS